MEIEVVLRLVVELLLRADVEIALRFTSRSAGILGAAECDRTWLLIPELREGVVEG